MAYVYTQILVLNESLILVVKIILFSVRLLWLTLFKCFEEATPHVQKRLTHIVFVCQERH